MSEHTKGPLAVGRSFRSGKINSVWTNDRGINVVVASMSRNFPEDETAANARLIAVAPDLRKIYEKLLEAGKCREDGTIIDCVHLMAEAVDMAQELAGKMEEAEK